MSPVLALGAAGRHGRPRARPGRGSARAREGVYREGVDDLDLSGAVDEVLDPVWPRERRRALFHMAGLTLGRVGVFLLALSALSLVTGLAFGLVVPWTFYAFVGGLALVCARPEPGQRSALRRGRDESRSSRPSTGCYPPTPLD